jgi:2-dehydro-3-deoxyphosphogluconate aldolase/(4S)-4-hydroxy-2-oxoglutarate aldolase
MCIGAGTVLNLELLQRALAAGATFIVTPVVNVEVIEECVRRKIPVFPGAYSPTEIMRAWELGATMVKVFPAETLGPSYVKAIKAPLPQVKLMPTGGVDLKTLGAYKKAGADGFGVGGPLFDRARVEAGDWNWIETQCRAFVKAYNSS